MSPFFYLKKNKTIIQRSVNLFSFLYLSGSCILLILGQSLLFLEKRKHSPPFLILSSLSIYLVFIQILFSCFSPSHNIFNNFSFISNFYPFFIIHTWPGHFLINKGRRLSDWFVVLSPQWSQESARHLVGVEGSIFYKRRESAVSHPSASN